MPLFSDRGSADNNRVLGALTGEVTSRLFPHMETVYLELKQPIHSAGEPLRVIYFPAGAVFAVFSRLENGSTVEISAVGHEGMFGVYALLGADRVPFDSFVQVPGFAHVIRAEIVMEELNRSPVLRDWLLRYTSACMNQISHTVACNRHHLLVPRLASRILTIRDRTDVDPIPVTHEFLAEVLGFGRPSVTRAAFHLQQSGLISYSRGLMSILDPAGLEEIACECYGLIRDDYEQLFR